jgi:hypothetical protein
MSKEIIYLIVLLLIIIIQTFYEILENIFIYLNVYVMLQMRI